MLGQDSEIGLLGELSCQEGTLVAVPLIGLCMAVTKW